MSTDKLTMQWLWTGGSAIRSSTNTNQVATLAIAGFGMYTVTFGWSLGSGTAGALVLTDGTNTATLDLYRTTVGSGVAEFAFEYYDPPYGTFLPHPCFRLKLEPMRGIDPVGAGRCRCYLTVDVLNPADETTVYRSTSFAVSTAGFWGHCESVTSQHTAGRALSDGLTVHAIDIEALSAPWPVEAVTTGELIGEGVSSPNHQKYVTTATGAETDIGIAPPFEGNLTVNPLTGRQFVARRNVDADTGLTVFTRAHADATWAAVSGALADASDFLRGGLMGTDAKGRQRLEAIGGPSNGETTLDDGSNWSAIGGSERHNFYVATGEPPTSFWVDPLTGAAMAAELDFTGSADRIYVRRYRQNDEVTVIANCRTSGEDGGTPHPIVYRRPDGRWAVLWFVNDAPREYVSGDGGATWADASPTEDWTAGAGSGYYTSFWKSISGRQVVAGYHFGDEEIVCLSRVSHDADWTGPYTILATSDCVAPYVYQRPDGVWESGWWLDDAWTLYRADHPAGTWSAV